MAELNGILCIDKPQDFTSFDVVAKMRGIAKTKKIGHAGTLDPMATGVLPLFFGRATKACDLLPRQDKAYRASFRLGQTTDTQDCTGTLLETRPVKAGKKEVEEALAAFRGEIQQIPPMYSAIKMDGKRLYELARQGIQVERKPRPVTIHQLELTGAEKSSHTYTIEVHCSKGTYIRSLVADIGEALGCGAVMTALRRTMAAGFTLESCITLEQAQELAGEGDLEQQLLPVERGFESLPKVFLSAGQTRLFRNGVRLDLDRISCPISEGQTAVYGPESQFLGLASPTEGQLKLVKLFALEV